MKDQIDKFIKEANTATGALATAREQRAKERYQELRSRRGKELDLWNQWHEGGRNPEHLEPLLQSLDPMISREATKRAKGLGGAIPHDSLKNELRNATVRAIQTYDPSKKTQLSTHVTNNFQRVSDFIAQNRNALYMSKENIGKYNEFSNARTEFMDLHGREPTALELQQKLPNLSIKRIKELKTGFSPEVHTSMGGDLAPELDAASPRDAFLLMKSRMSPDEQRFAEFHLPPEGERQLTPKEISSKMGIPQHRVYDLKMRVERIIGPVLKKE
jgi:hypothetical protein